YAADGRPIDETCDCPACRKYTRAYLRHLFKCGEMLAMRLAVLHNLYFYNEFMARVRDALGGGEFDAFRARNAETLARRV
ncbi:MAG: tRNA-guanine transglycosylase, partial [Oscillospiraceae bacterium]|nr:tRNA-guanine transglycosylase [Oscillospiraceae bacterium]